MAFHICICWLLLGVGNGVNAQVLNPIDFTSLGPSLSPASSLVIDTKDGVSAPTLQMDGGSSIDGVIAGAAGGNGVQLAVFTFNKIDISSAVTVTVTGKLGLALLSRGTAQIDTPIVMAGGDGGWHPANLGEKLIGFYDFSDTGSMTLNGSQIEKIASQGGYRNDLLTTNAPTLNGETAEFGSGSYLGGSRATIQEAVVMGFTCTGLAWDEAEQCWWVGHHPTTLKKFSADFTTVLQSVDLATLSPTMGMQGVTVDTSDQTLWIAGGNEVLHINKACDTLYSQYDINTVSGIAYDPTLDRLWLADTTGKLRRIDKSGIQEVAPLAVAGSNGDHLYLDDARRLIYFTYGSNNVDGKVAVADVSREVRMLQTEWTLVGADAIEGIHVDADTGEMWVMNDAGFHGGSPAVDRALRYQIQPVLREDSYDVYWLGQEYAQASLGAAWGMGAPVAAFGLAQYKPAGDNANQQITASTNTSGSEQFSTTWSQDLVSAEGGSGIFWNNAGGQYQSVVNGTIGTAVATSGVVGSVPIHSLHLGIANPVATDPLRVDIRGMVVAKGLSADERDKLHGFMHWHYGRQDLLPVTHPYKTVAP